MNEIKDYIVYPENLEIYLPKTIPDRQNKFLKGLAYNDNNTTNRNSLLVAGGLALLSIFAIVYVSLIIGGKNLPLSTLDIEAQYFMLTAFILAFINAAYVVLFPLLAYEDQSLQDKK